MQKRESSLVFAYGAITRYGVAFQQLRLTNEFFTPLLPPKADPRRVVFLLLERKMFLSYNPDGYKYLSVWAPPVSLAATQGITFVLYSSAY